MNRCVRCRLMARRSRSFVVAIVVFSFVFAILAYACPERDMAWGSAMRLTPHNEMEDMGPCGDAEPHICRLVRDRMLSVGISSASLAAISHYELAAVSHPAMVEAAIAPMICDRGPPLLPPFHRVFKLQLPLSYLVLRL